MLSLLRRFLPASSPPNRPLPAFLRRGMGELGAYQLIKRLGAGGMAEVWLARTSSGQLVVLKTILPHLAHEPHIRSCFRDEIRITGQLDHRNIAHCLDAGSVSGRDYMALEFVPGETLWDLSVRCRTAGIRMPVALTLRLAAELAEALDYAHQRCARDGRRLGITHSDVSPQNIMVDETGKAVLIDFGVADARDNEHLNLPGALYGKLSYLSPEQANGQSTDARTDQFALCVVLWELLAGQRLFAGGGAAQIVRRVLAGAPESVSAFRPGLPWTLAAALARGLSTSPQERFPSCAALARVLRNLARQDERQKGSFDYTEWRANLLRLAPQTLPLPITAQRKERELTPHCRSSVTRRLPDPPPID
jgi:serine/threonine protein kinase